VANNPYAKRVQDIMDTNERNAALDWMVQDIAEGDAVAKAYEVYQEQQEKEKAEAKTKAEKPVEDPYAGEAPAAPTKPSSKKSTSLKKKLAENRRKHQAKMDKIKNSYERRRARFNNWKRSTLNAVPIPGFHQIVAIGNKLFTYYLPLGYYSIAKFVEDLQYIMSDVDIMDVLGDIKRAYINKAL